MICKEVFHLVFIAPSHLLLPLDHSSLPSSNSSTFLRVAIFNVLLMMTYASLLDVCICVYSQCYFVLIQSRKPDSFFLLCGGGKKKK